MQFVQYKNNFVILFLPHLQNCLIDIPLSQSDKVNNFFLTNFIFGQLLPQFKISRGACFYSFFLASISILVQDWLRPQKQVKTGLLVIWNSKTVLDTWFLVKISFFAFFPPFDVKRGKLNYVKTGKKGKELCSQMHAHTQELNGKG